MNLLHRLFPAGHFVIGLLFLTSALVLVGVAAVKLWQGIQLESIAVLTVAVAALELGRTILEERCSAKRT